MGDHEENEKDNYLFGRGGLASNRLTTQHFVLSERQGWLLHPNITNHLSKQDQSKLKIGDIATGNGIWAIGIAKSYPEAEITGLDISPQQFPPSFTRPANVTFDLYNIFDPVPDRFKSYFDVLHIRLIVAAIYDKDKDVLFNNFRTMLKPGGYIQWEEIIREGPMVVDSHLEVDRTTRPYISRIDKATGVMSALRWADAIPKVLEEKGFIEVVRHEPPLNTSLLQHESECMAWSMEEVIGEIHKNPDPEVKEEMETAMRELRRDSESEDTLLAYDWDVAVGRKPM